MSSRFERKSDAVRRASCEAGAQGLWVGSQQRGGVLFVGKVGVTFPVRGDPQRGEHPLGFLERVPALEVLQEVDEVFVLQRLFEGRPAPHQVVGIAFQDELPAVSRDRQHFHASRDDAGQNQQPVAHVGTSALRTGPRQMQERPQQIDRSRHRRGTVLIDNPLSVIFPERNDRCKGVFLEGGPNPAVEDDFRWLISPAAREWLERADLARGSLVSLAQTLRKRLTPQRTHLVIQQIELRRRGLEKFSRASEMFFTRELLEQSTDEQIAHYKALRCRTSASGKGPVADLCCGIGGDLLGLAQHGLAIGIDFHPVAAWLAQANLEALGFSNGAVRTADVTRLPLDEFTTIHIDPDRRPQGSRTTNVEFSQPGLDFLSQLVRSRRPLAIKLAPAASLPDEWHLACQREWIGSRGECRQQVAWFGGLGMPGGPSDGGCGMPARAATVVCATAAPRTIFGQGDEPTPLSDSIRRFVYEPHPAVIAARLMSPLAAEHDLAAIEPGIAYLTGDRLAADPALAAFEVLEVLPFDIRRLKAILRQRRVGRLEVKKRDVTCDPRRVARALAGTGTESATLLLLPVRGSTTAIVARRPG